jgi:hypothetical protein
MPIATAVDYGPITKDRQIEARPVERHHLWLQRVDPIHERLQQLRLTGSPICGAPNELTFQTPSMRVATKAPMHATWKQQLEEFVTDSRASPGSRRSSIGLAAGA